MAPPTLNPASNFGASQVRHPEPAGAGDARNSLRLVFNYGFDQCNKMLPRSESLSSPDISDLSPRRRPLTRLPTTLHLSSGLRLFMMATGWDSLEVDTGESQWPVKGT
jgi:hypothetical protein